MPRTILHADMDAFYAALEQRDDPSLRGRPVVVGGLGPRGVVSTASYEARRFGVHSALPTALARRRCPDAVFLPPRMEVYAREGARIRDVFARFTPLVEPLSLDEAFLDVSGSTLLFGEGRRIAERLKHEVREVTGLNVSVGVAASKFVAKVASDLDKPDGLVVVEPGGEEAFLAPLPVGRLWGLGPKARDRLEERGIFRIAQLQELPEARLIDLFGEAMGAHFAALCHGRDDRPVVAEREPVSISHETTFSADLCSRDELGAVLLGLSEAVGARLRAKGLRGTTLRLKLRFPPFETHTRQRRLAVPSADDVEIWRGASALLDEANPDGRPVRLVGVGLADLVPEGHRAQGLLWDATDPRRGRALEALDRIRDKHGRDAIGHGRDATGGSEP